MDNLSGVEIEGDLLESTKIEGELLEITSADAIRAVQDRSLLAAAELIKVTLAKPDLTESLRRQWEAALRMLQEHPELVVNRPVAQPGPERLLHTQEIGGSNPPGPTIPETGAGAAAPGGAVAREPLLGEQLPGEGLR
jgi:hypothetical protein